MTLDPTRAASEDAPEDTPPEAPDGAAPGEALCFTAGYKAGPFAAGVIHAWLAADREAPAIAAGISYGALSAAVLQRCYQELEAADPQAGQAGNPCSETELKEVRRWRWFRRYLNALSEAPLQAIWRALPNPVDFFADRPPVQDGSAPEPLREHEISSRRDYYLLVKLGRWLARLPLSLHTLAKGAVAYVRQKEGYGSFALLRWLAVKLFFVRVGLQLLIHLVFRPQWFLEGRFRDAPSRAVRSSLWRRALYNLRGFAFRPLFGWDVWLTGVICLGSLISFLGLCAWIVVTGRSSESAIWLIWTAFVAALLGGFSAWRLYYLSWKRPHAARNLGVDRGLLHEYALRRALFSLFADDENREPLLRKEPFPVLLAAAPLQSLPYGGELRAKLSGQQVWAGTDTPLLTALRAALCIPGFLPPLHLKEKERILHWISNDRIKGNPPTFLDLVDGSVVRRNPIPALFSYLHKADSEKGDPAGQVLNLAEIIRKRLESTGTPRLHVVYGVPVEALPAQRQQRVERLDIVEVAFLSLELANRRDTQLELRQTNFISRVEHQIRSMDPSAAGEKDPVPIFADAIAPEEEIRFRDSLNPSRKEVLTCVASGCRRSLENLYQEEIRTVTPKDGAVPCHRLLRRIATGRRTFITPEAPGLSEVCRHCTRQLAAVALEAEPQAPPSFAPTFWVPQIAGEPDPAELFEKFRHLSGEKPRIVFVASGGVFRGASHIGVLGALHALGVWPDLIVGASVGSLMGGALGAISVQDDPDEALGHLARLAATFVHVDRHVALTRELKNAAKQLGVRGRKTRLSPRQLRRLISLGSRSDPGYAATGAPPALIDAIAELLLLPHRTTARIAAQFVAGHYTRAVNLFWSQIKQETLRRLDIRHAVMGTSLLEGTARGLLGEGKGISLGCDQPYHQPHPDRKVSFFCTTTDLASGSSVLLGRDFPNPCHAYDFTEASLSSSAFPAVFSPRRASRVFPGLGPTDLLFADGGMFDNLPFIPAMEVMAAVQRAGRKSGAITRSRRDFLGQRYRQPDLFIAAALDAAPEPKMGERFESLLTIRKRSRRLKNNLKIEAFDRTSQLISRQLGRLLTASEKKPDRPFQDPPFIDSIVHGAVLKVVPTDRDHINETFAFSATTGLDVGKVQTAIADGCFQTLKSLTEAWGSARSDQDGVLDRSILALHGHGRLPEVGDRPGARPPRKSGLCPFFIKDGEDLKCPFYQAAGVAEVPGEIEPIFFRCRKDSDHRRWQRRRREAQPPAE